MSPRMHLPLAMALFAGAAGLISAAFSPLAAAAPAAGTPALASTTPRPFLPDTFALARVDGKPIRVSEYVHSYFNSYAEFRPAPDSAGRVEFLNTMINKEVLALAAKRANRPLGFEDRIQIRDDTERALGNTLFQRSVLDSAWVSEEETRKLYETYRYDQHFRQIIFDDKTTAERVKADLLAKRIQWDDAVRRYHHANRDTARSSDLGWVSRTKVDRDIALRIYGLAPGEISPIIFDRAGYRIIQSVERRPVRAAAFGAMQKTLRQQLLNDRRGVLARRLQAQVGAGIGLTYDSTNIVWASARFGTMRNIRYEGGAPTIEINAGLPEISDADTGRVLARHRDGQFTLGAFLHAFSELSPVSRPEVGDPDAFRDEVAAIVLAPYMAKLAIERGLDRDSLTVATLQQRREQMMVDHLFQDSIESKVRVTPQQRRKYYDEHIAQYHTYATVRFAGITRWSKTSADSVAAALKAGAKAQDILSADARAGQVSGSIQEQREDQPGRPYHKILFQELRPGQATVVGPDREGVWAVLQVLEYDRGRQLSFQEADAMVSESVHNVESERLLKALVQRARKRHRIESHPELVMRVLLSDPTLLD